MVKRKGLGKGQGKGYKNLVSNDPLVHSMSARGMTQKQVLKRMDNDFGFVPTEEKKGFIKELARKAVDGVKWAVEWEKEHLPDQLQWVKDEFNEAKTKIKAGIDDIKGKTQKQIDAEDVRDELDHDEDGVADIDISELEDVNEGISYELQDIDLNQNDIPDAQEDGTFNLGIVPPLFPPSGEPELTNVPESMAKNIIPLDDEKECEKPKGKVSNFIKNVRSNVSDYLETQRLESERIKGLSDKELKKLALQEGQTLFGNNRYENEIVARTKERVRLQELVKKAKKDVKDKFKAKKDVPNDLIGKIFRV